MTRASAVLVDNGEPTILECIVSLRRQTVPVEIVLAPGPRTNIELVKSLVDKVCEPTVGIGRARVKAILMASSEYIVSCDSDCIYDEHYVQYALEDLESCARAVKAGTILPLKWDILSMFESALSLLPPYEFALAFKKSEALRAGLLEEAEKFGDNPRWDIGWLIVRKLNPIVDFRMKLRAEMPTTGALKFTREYLPPLAASTIPLALISGILLATRT